MPVLDAVSLIRAVRGRAGVSKPRWTTLIASPPVHTLVESAGESAP